MRVYSNEKSEHRFSSKEPKNHPNKLILNSNTNSFNKENTSVHFSAKIHTNIELAKNI